MLNVQINTGTSMEHVFSVDAFFTVEELWHRFEEITKFPRDHFYMTYNGRLVDETDTCLGDENGCCKISPKLLGGKGGFGSMLRAIGAQIEKTTNREACRDLSGRRLRDINEEKRLKAWIEKQTKREEEAAERKKKKLERLCAEPKHEFKDQNYEHERSVLTERVGEAVEEGFKVTTVGTSVKRTITEETKPNKKKKTLLDLDIDSDDLDTSEDSNDDEECSRVNQKNLKVSNDSGHSSDESAEMNKSSRVDDEHSETSSDIQVTDKDSTTSDSLKEGADRVNTSDTECMKVRNDCSQAVVEKTN